jgi:ectoine hydroxylase
MTREKDRYPSRQGGNGELLEREDPVVYSDRVAGAPLTPQQIEAYGKDGFLDAGQLFDKTELETLVKERDRLRTEYSGSRDESIILEPNGKVVRSIFDVHKVSKLFARVARDSRLADVARFLLDDDVYIHQSRLNYKPGFFGRQFYWHSDFETWHVEDGMPGMRALSVSISLTDNLDINGPLMLIPRSHRRFVCCRGETPDDNYRRSLQRQEYGVPDPAMLRKLVDKGGIRTVTGNAGAVAFFDCNTMHGSNSNISPFPRSNVFIVYNAVSNRVVDPFGVDRPRPDFLAERHDFSAVEPVAGRVR